jgi:hypothetical protein
MPNDSVGKDMRGKWLTPGTRADLDAGSLPNKVSPTPDELANILIFKAAPDFSKLSADDLYAVVAQGELQILEASSD